MRVGIYFYHVKIAYCHPRSNVTVPLVIPRSAGSLHVFPQLLWDSLRLEMTVIFYSHFLKKETSNIMKIDVIFLYITKYIIFDIIIY